MDKEKIKIYDVLKNPRKPFCGYVVAIDKNVTLMDLQDAAMTFDPEYLEQATKEEAAPFKAKIEAKRQEEEGKPVVRRIGKEKAPEEIQAGLERYVSEMAQEHPVSAKHFKVFWGEIVDIVGDFPGNTWDMRWRSKDHFCPVLKSPSRRTNEWVNCLYLLCGENVRLEIRKSYLPEEYDQLFPIRNAMMGSTHAVKMDWAAFRAGPKAQYLKLIRKLSEKWRKK